MPFGVIACTPGLGSYTPGMLRRARSRYPQVDEVFSAIDPVARRHGAPVPSAALFGPTILSAAAIEALSPTTMMLAIFGASVAAFRIVTAGSLRPYAVCGHSFGEIAALTAAGAFAVADGAEIVCRRTAALTAEEGRQVMTAIGAREETVRHLIAAVGPELSIACRNAPAEVVVCGPAGSMTRLEGAARALEIFVARLATPYGSHHPSLIRRVDHLRQALADMPQQPLGHVVYSPIFNRRYTDADDLTGCIAGGIARPVSYTAIVRRLHADGGRIFIESGPGRATTRAAQLTVPDLRVFAPLYNPEEEIAQFELIEREVGSAADRSPRSVAGSAAAFTPATMPVVAQPLAANVEREPIIVPTFPAAALGAAPAPGIALDRKESGDPPLARSVLLNELRTLYATVLDYPPEFLSDDTELEGELGVDSLKQTTLLTRAFERFGVEQPSGGFRMWEYRTLGHIADLLLSARADAQVS